MKIYVTQRHITTASKRNSHHCMIADAIVDSVDGAKYVLVDLQSIRWTDKLVRERYVYLTPPVCQESIIKFDRGIKCHPFIFNLNSPQIKNTQRGRKRDKRRRHDRSPGAHLRMGRVAYKDREYGIRQFKK